MVADSLPIGKTSDTRIVVGTVSQAHELLNILGLSIGGGAAITTEPFLGSEAEDASVHAASKSIGFTTVYDSDAFRTAVALLLPGNRGTNADDPAVAVICPSTPVSWEVIPVDYASPAWVTSQTDAIFRPWAMTRRDRAMHGVLVREFTTVAGTALALGNSQDGTTIADAVQVLVLTDVPAAVTDIEFSDGSADTDIPHTDGIHVVDNTTAAGAMTIESTAGAIEGFLLQGMKEILPSG